MKKRYFKLMIFLCIMMFILVGCGNKSENEKKQQENNVLENETSNLEETESVIKAGDYTLEYGTYIDKYGTKYTLNKDGTFNCESTSLPYNSGTGIFKVFYFEDSLWEFDYPADIREGWYIGFNLDSNKKDETKPWLFENTYNIEGNNEFYNAQTDEIWTLE